MRYALIMAGGSGTRLWPMSRNARPKQILPILGGKSLLQIAFERLDGLLPNEQRFICAGERHRQGVLAAVPGLGERQFLGEPVGRDTLAAVGLGAAVAARRDADAVMGVFTADHIIEPVASFQEIIARGFELVEQSPETLVTFGIEPTGPATGYGYLELGEPIGAAARRVDCFREKPPLEVAREYFAAGPTRYLWNSGMFVWRAATLLDCIGRYQSEVHAGLMEAAAAWDTPRREAVLAAVYPKLKKISVDFAVMEPASRDAAVRVAAIPMPLAWLDVGSWPAFAETCPRDADGNALAAGRPMMLGSRGCLAASDDPNHLVTMVGCENLIVIHTKNATLVCPADRAEEIKKAAQEAGERFGEEYT